MVFVWSILFYYRCHFTNFFKIDELEEIVKKNSQQVSNKNINPFQLLWRENGFVKHFWSHIYFTIDGDVSIILY